MGDVELLTAHASGDEQALEGLMRRYYPLVCSAAVRRVGDWHLAEDIAQSVFILLSRKAASLAPDVPLDRWLLRTTELVSCDALRQIRRRARREEEAVKLSPPSSGQTAGGTNFAPLVLEALARLSDKERECVVARFVEDQSFRKIGEQQSITDDAAQKRVSRGLSKMKQFMELHGVKAGAVEGLCLAVLARPADAQLLEAALKGVHASASAAARLADGVARTLLRRIAIKVACSLAGAAALAGGIVVARDRAEPAIPGFAAFQISDSRIGLLATTWSSVTARAAATTHRFSRVPAAGNIITPELFKELQTFSLEGDRVRAEFKTDFQGNGTPDQLAEFLTVEFRETLGLSPPQQTAVFALLRDELTRGAASGNASRGLVRNKAAVGAQIRQWLSPRQRRRFDYTYGVDYLGLFTFLKLN
jgi:RNA polymerase sigma factor (sigma-70 family)